MLISWGLLAATGLENASAEFRGLWVDAFGPGFFDSKQVATLVSDCHAYGFNPELVANVAMIGQLTPIYIHDSDAAYYFTRQLTGKNFVFIVTFVKENGQWKILSF